VVHGQDAHAWGNQNIFFQRDAAQIGKHCARIDKYAAIDADMLAAAAVRRQVNVQIVGDIVCDVGKYGADLRLRAECSW